MQAKKIRNFPLHFAFYTFKVCGPAPKGGVASVICCYLHPLKGAAQCPLYSFLGVQRCGVKQWQVGVLLF